MFNYLNFMSETGPNWGGEQGWNFGQFAQDFREMGISDPFNVRNIQGALTEAAGREVPLNMIASLSKENMQGSQFGTYRPYIHSQTGSILSELQANLSNITTKQAHGGFAGTSSSGRRETQAKDIFGQKATKVLQDVNTWQQQGRRSVMDIVQSWRDAASIFQLKT